MRVITVGTRAGSDHERWLAAIPQASIVAGVPAQTRAAADDPPGPCGCRTRSAGAELALIRGGTADVIVLDPAAPLSEEVIEAVFGSRALIVVEVPVGMTAVGAEHLDRIAARLGANTVVPFHWRESPALRDVRAALADGVLGDLLTVDVTVLAEASAPVPDGPLGGAGALADPGLHAFDLLSWLTDQPGWRVEHAWSRPAARGSRAAGVADDDGTLAQVALAPAGAGGQARIQVGRIVVGERRLEVSVLGTGGSARVRADPADGSAVLVLRTGSRELRRSYPANTMNPYWGLTADPVVSGFTGRATFADAARALRLMEAAARAAGQAYRS